MPPLENQRHELFCQHLAKGKTADEAYELAGFKPNRGNAATLKAKQSISARVSDLQDRAASRTEVTVANITERLLAIAKKGETAADAPLLSVARAALMDAAKLNGLVVDKSMSATASLEDLLDQIGGEESSAPATTH